MSSAFSSMYNLYEDSEKIVHFDILKLHPHIRYEYTLGAIMVMIIIFILVIIVLVATILDFLKLNGKTTKETNPLEHVEIREGSKSSEVDTLLEKPTTRSTSKIFKLLYKIFNTVHKSPISVFSLYKTLPLLFNTKPSKFPQLNCLNLIRVISIYWVAAGHTYGSFVDLAPVDGLDILKSFKNPYFVILANSFFSVDTFFFLVTYLFKYRYLKFRVHF